MRASEMSLIGTSISRLYSCTPPERFFTTKQRGARDCKEQGEDQIAFEGALDEKSKTFFVRVYLLKLTF